MLKLDDKPVISYVVKSLETLGSKEINLTVNHGGSEMIQYLTHNFPYLEFKFLNDPLLGTGQSMDLLRDIDADYFLVAMGDMVFDNQILQIFIEAFKKNPANYILSKEVINPEKYGVLEVRGGKVIKIHEKPENPPSNLVNLGLYIFNKSIFEFTNNLELSSRGEYEITDAIQASINAGNEFRYFIHDNEIIDITTPKDLLQKITSN